MFSQVKLTRSGIPIPLDSSGREMCLLFVKYGRCRFKNKCKKSHWTPPLPDEEYQHNKPPPLPPYPPPSSVSEISSKRQDTGHDNCMTDEQRQNMPAFQANYNQNKSSPHLKISNGDCIPSDRGESNSQGFFDTSQTFNQEGQESSNVDQITEVTQWLSMHRHHPVAEDIQSDNNVSELISTNIATMLPASTAVIGTNIEADVAINTDKEIQGLKGIDIGSTTVDSTLTTQAMETAMDRISQVVFKMKCRFDFVYHPDIQAKGVGWKYKSSVDRSYEKYGAYCDHVRKKLEFLHQPCNKVEKKNLKLLRKAHWNTCQELKARLAQLPPGYSLRVDFTRVNFSRLWPYFYLLVHQCFFCAEPTSKRWKPSPFSCLVAETVIAFFASGTTPAEAEKRMQDWGGRPVRIRQCISHLWNVIVKSSLSTSGVAQEVLNCEHQVFAKKISALDYAYACSLAGPLVKGHTSHLANKSAPTIIKSVRQGIQATKKASLLQTKRTQSKPSRISGNCSSRTNGRSIEPDSRTLDCGVTTTKGARWNKKRRTKRPQQFALLGEKGKKDLLKRCQTILKE